MRLEGKTALVTGGNRGIGRAVATRFAREGAKVAILARTRADLEETASSIRAAGGEVLTLPCDLASADEIEAAVHRCAEAFGHVDVLINNAALYEPTRRALQTTVQDYDTLMAVNLRAPWLCAKHVAPHMPRDGSIVNVTTGLARGPASGYFPYSLSKWALEGLTFLLAAELPQRVNAVNPGLVSTRMSHYSGTDPNDVTEVFVYLASDESKGTTGQVLRASQYRDRAGSG